MTDYAFLAKLGVEVTLAAPVLHKRNKKTLQAIQRPGKGMKQLRHSLRKTLGLLMSEGAVKTRDPKRLAKIICVTVNTLFFDKNIPKVDFSAIAVSALEDSPKEEQEEPSKDKGKGQGVGKSSDSTEGHPPANDEKTVETSEAESDQEEEEGRPAQAEPSRVAKRGRSVDAGNREDPAKSQRTKTPPQQEDQDNREELIRKAMAEGDVAAIMRMTSTSAGVKHMGVTLNWFATKDGRIRIDGCSQNKELAIRVLRASLPEYTPGSTPLGARTGAQAGPDRIAKSSARAAEAAKLAYDNERKNKEFVLKAALLFDPAGSQGIWDVLDKTHGVKSLPKQNITPWALALASGPAVLVHTAGNINIEFGCGYSLGTVLSVEDVLTKHFSAQWVPVAEFRASIPDTPVRVKFGTPGPKARALEMGMGFRSARQGY